MPLQNKRSFTPGNRINLATGEIAVQVADELFLMRLAGRRVEVDLNGWLRRTPPVAGVAGAPLQRLMGGVGWASNLVPIGYVDGAVRVDLPPAGYGVPGLEIVAAGAPLTLTADEVTANVFYVASETLRLTGLSWYVPDAGGGLAMRVGILDAGGEVLLDLPTTAVAGANTLDVDLALPRGTYSVVLWTAGPISLRTVEGYHAEQGWDYVTSGAPRFVSRLRDVVDMSAGLSLPAGEVTRATPGETHAVLTAWTV